MNNTQYELIKKKNSNNKKIKIGENISEDFTGTLLYGSILNDGDFFHLYVEDSMIKLLRYFRMKNDFAIEEHKSGKEMDVSYIIEDKRVFPEGSLFSFIQTLEKSNKEIVFSSFNHNAPELIEGTFYPLAWKI